MFTRRRSPQTSAVALQRHRKTLGDEGAHLVRPGVVKEALQALPRIGGTQGALDPLHGQQQGEQHEGEGDRGNQKHGGHYGDGRLCVTNTWGLDVSCDIGHIRHADRRLV